MNRQWTIEEINEWYNDKPWIRGTNFCASHFGNHEFYSTKKNEQIFIDTDNEFKLMHEWGFNVVRFVFSFGAWYFRRDIFYARIEEYISLAAKNGIFVMPVLGDDCCVIKKYFSFTDHFDNPTRYDYGYHGGAKISPHVVLPEPGFSFLDVPEYEKAFYEYVYDLISHFKNDRRIIIWDLFNEPGNSMRGDKTIPYLKNIFDAARKADPIQPLTSGCWNYNENNEISNVEKLAMGLSDISTFHCYLENSRTMEIAALLLEKYKRPLINTEWLHRIWHNDIDPLYKFFYENKIGSINWGFVNGISQTQEPWEWLFHEYDLGHGDNWDFTKWQHDLVRANLRPYDYKEFKIITEINKKAA